MGTHVFDIPLSKQRTIAQMLANGEMFDVIGAAKILGIGPNYLRHLCRIKRVQSFKILGKIYLTKAQLSSAIRPFSAAP